MGKSGNEVIEVLGHPDRVLQTKSMKPELTTYNYSPYPFTFFGKFQVHFVDKVVTGIEPLDD